MVTATFVIGLSHIGIRVLDYAKTRAFYELLGFEHAWGPAGPDQVAAMRHPSGVEINLIVNAQAATSNILMDVPQKHAGITHIALQVSNVPAAEAAMTAAGIEITGRRGAQAIFIRDPDRNVIELAAD
jgi:lactoylglutathione lyase